MKAIKNLVIVLLVGTIIASVAVNVLAAEYKTVPVDKQGNLPPNFIATLNGTENSTIAKSLATAAAEKTKKDPPKSFDAPKIILSKEEQALNDQLINARKTGKVKEAQNIEEKIAALHGKKLSYIKSFNVTATSNNTTNNTTKIVPLWTNWPDYTCLTCGMSGIAGYPNIVHDQNDYLYVAVSNVYNGRISIFQSKNKGIAGSWSLLTVFSPGQMIGEASLAVAGNYLFVASYVKYYEGIIRMHKVVVNRININDLSMTETDFDAEYGSPKIVTDYVEWPQDPWVYLIFDNQFTRSTNGADPGNGWETPREIPGAGLSSSAIDYGFNTLYVSYTKGTPPNRYITEITGGSFGDYWNVGIAGISTPPGDAYDPTVSVVKYIGPPYVVIAYTLNYYNSGDTDVMYAYYDPTTDKWTYPIFLAGGYNDVEDEPAITNDGYYYFNLAYRYDLPGFGNTIATKWADIKIPTSWSNEETVAWDGVNGNPMYPTITDSWATGIAWIDPNYGQVYFNTDWY